MQTPTQKRRLNRLAKFIESLPAKRFDLSEIVKRFDEEKTCGTVCCAIGWMPSVFPTKCKWMPSYNSLRVVSTDGQSSDFAFASIHFGLTGEECAYLFEPLAYPKHLQGRKSVSSRIREFVKTQKIDKTCLDDWYF